MEQTRRIYPNEIIIDNIDPIAGVTPEQLIEFLKKITYTIKVAARLNLDEIQDAIHYTVMAITTKMEEGTVPKHNFHDFKDYLFISFRNFLFQRIDVRKRLKNLPNSTKFDFTLSVPDDYIVIDPYISLEERIDKTDSKMDELNKILKKLSPFDLEIINRLLNGEKAKTVSRSVGKIPNYAYNLIHKLKCSINPKLRYEPTAKDRIKKKSNGLTIDKEFLETLTPNYNEIYDELTVLKTLRSRIQHLLRLNFTKYHITAILHCSLTTVNNHKPPPSSL